MIYLFLSIGCTTLIYLLFRAFQKYKVDSLPAIVINYCICSITGLFFLPEDAEGYFTSLSPGFWGMCLALGFGFIIVFNLMNMSTQLLGVAGGTVVSRMSLVIPASYSIVLLGEGLSWMKGMGILLALASIYFTVFSKKDKSIPETKLDKGFGHILIPILAFLGVGATDTMLKFADVRFLQGKNDPGFVFLTYLFAFIGGSLFVLIRRVPLRLFAVRKNLLWGAILGVFNYFSIYFFVLALTQGHIEGSRMFPINSVGIVAFSTIASIILFREHVSLRKGFGLAMALAAILLISLG